MSTQIFVNLPVKDLDRSVDFFTKLGYKFDPQFTDPKAACMVISEDIFAMLLTESYFATFTTKSIVDAKQNTEVLVALTQESREAVDEIVQKAVAAGGKAHSEPKDHGFMYAHGFEDLDGHVWEVFQMDRDAINHN